MEADTLGVFIKILIAMAFGAILGLEREYKSKPAGIRTHMLIAGASALLVLIGLELVELYDASSDANFAVDPTRLIQAIVIGISFVGAGTVLKAEKSESILYLTTAASILFTAAIGIAVATGEMLLAGALTLVAVSSMYIIGKIEERYNR